MTGGMAGSSTRRVHAASSFATASCCHRCQPATERCSDRRRGRTQEHGSPPSLARLPQRCRQMPCSWPYAGDCACPCPSLWDAAARRLAVADRWTDSVITCWPAHAPACSPRRPGGGASVYSRRPRSGWAGGAGGPAAMACTHHGPRIGTRGTGGV